MMPRLATARDIAMFASLVVTAVAFALYIVGLVLSSVAVRAGILNLRKLIDRVPFIPLRDRLVLGDRMLASVFENEHGFARARFVLLMLIVNGAAVYARFMAINYESADIYARLGPFEQWQDDAEMDALGDFFVSALLFSPIHLFTWSWFDYQAYAWARQQMEEAIAAESTAPVIYFIIGLIVFAYAIPIAFFFSGIGLLALFANLTPLTPLVHAIMTARLCWHCSALMLPAGLSVTLSLVLVATAFVTVSSHRLLKGAARLCERVERLPPERLRNVTMEIIGVASAVLLFLTWRDLPWGK